MTEFKKTVETLIPFVKKVTDKDADKALRDLAATIASALFETGVNVEQYIADYNADKIIDPSCLLNNVDDWHDFIYDRVKYEEFCDVMFQKRPVGLGTPNAMVGEGEALFLFCSPRVGISKEKGKGDLKVDGKNVELKGFEFRVFSEITGEEFQRKITSIANEYGFKPNYVDSRGPGKSKRYAFEPWGISKRGKDKKQDHWLKQFNNVGEGATKEFLMKVAQLLSPTFLKEHIDASFDDEGKFVAIQFQKEMAKQFFLNSDNEWDAFTVVTNTRVVTINSDPTQFNTLIDNSSLYISENFLRSFQSLKYGIYLRFSDAVDRIPEDDIGEEDSDEDLDFASKKKTKTKAAKSELFQF